jgi:hypothetical protein
MVSVGPSNVSGSTGEGGEAAVVSGWATSIEEVAAVTESVASDISISGVTMAGSMATSVAGWLGVENMSKRSSSDVDESHSWD